MIEGLVVLTVVLLFPALLAIRRVILSYTKVGETICNEHVRQLNIDVEAVVKDLRS